MSMLDIDSMRALIAIAEAGGITPAAKNLNLSQSAVSHKMKRLEQRLNRSLYSRADGRMHLSHDGERLLGYARRMIKLHDEACASFHQSDLSGILRLGITEDVTAAGMGQILSSFTLSYPNVTLTSQVAHTPDLVRWLQRGEIDMALIEVFESERLDSDHQLGKQEPVWLLPTDFRLGDHAVLPFVAYHQDCFYKAWAETALAEINRSLLVVFTCPSIDGIVNAVSCGLGVGLVNFNVFEQLPVCTELRVDYSTLPQPPPTAHVARFAPSGPTPQMNRLLELIKQELAAPCSPL